MLFNYLIKKQNYFKIKVNNSRIFNLLHNNLKNNNSKLILNNKIFINRKILIKTNFKVTKYKHFNTMENFIIKFHKQITMQ